MMQYLPIFLDVKQQPCMVVGGGEVAARKIALLLRANAQITVVSPTLCTSLAALATQGEIQHIAREYQVDDLDNAVLVIAATNDVTLNQQIAQAARERKLPVNVVDNPANGSFINSAK